MTTITGTSGNDTLSGDAADDEIQGLGGNDLLQGQAGNDLLLGDVGQDSLWGGEGDDTLDGGTNDSLVGTDWAYYNGATAAVSVNLTTGLAAGGAGNDTLTGVESVLASDYNDTLVGNSATNFLEGGLGDDVMDGAGGSDWVSYQFATSAMTVSLATGTASGQGSDTFVNMERIRGGAFGDSLTGDGFGNYLRGSGGNDTLTGNGGNDIFQWDTLEDSGTDRITDFGYNDILMFQAGSGPLTLTGPILAGDTPTSLAQGRVMVGTPSGGVTKVYVGTDSVAGADLTIELVGSYTPSSFFISGDAYAGYLYATGPGSGNDSLLGSAHADTIDGSGGNDTIDGLGGNDSLLGNSGDDSITGGAGDDTLTGGSGNDTFAFDLTQANGIDRITDFVQHTDALSFSGPDFALNSNILSGNDASALAQGSVMVGTPSGGLTRIYIGTDSVAGADVTIDLTGNFTAGYFAPYNHGWGASLRYETPMSKVGTSGDDTLMGGVANDTLTGNNGNDLLNGMGGDDNLGGVDGNDTLTGGAGIDTMYGGSGNDTFEWDPREDSGIDRVADFGAGDSMQFRADGGLLTLSGSILSGDAPTSLAQGQVMVGTPSGGVTRLYVGADSVAGGDLTIDLEGNFLLSYFSVSNDTAGGHLNFAGPGSGNDSILGTVAADTVDGLGGDDTITGLDGNDSLVGNSGNDILSGDAGADTLSGGSGSDTFQWDTQQDSGIDRVADFSAGDRLQFRAGSGALTLSGPVLSGDTPTSLAQGEVMVGTPSGGVTRLYVGTDSVAGADLTIDLLGNFAAFGFSISNDTVGGYLNFAAPTNSSELLLGTPGADTIDGLGGDDTIAGLDGNDSLLGNSGNDSISGGTGADTLGGGSGNDTFQWDTQQDGGIDRVTDFGTGDRLQFQAGGGPLTFSGLILSGDSPTSLAQGEVMVGTPSGGVTRLHVGTDSVAGADLTIDLVGSFSTSNFSISNDTIGGYLNFAGPTAGDDLLLGTALADTIDGLGGDDTIGGQGGNDSLLGNSGDDSLSGGTGADTLSGGSGNDTFQWNTQQVSGVDRVTDFGAGDRLQFQAGGGPLTLSGPVLSGNAPTSLAQGEVMVGTPSGGVTRLYVGADSVAGVDLTIDLVGSFGAFGFSISNDTVAGYLNFAGPTAGNDSLLGTAVAETIDGLGGDDAIAGEGGNDSLLGNSGNDSISGGAGADTLSGGSGNDTFQWDTQQASGIDRVSDFGAGDRLQFRAGSGAFTLTGPVLSGTPTSLSQGQAMVGTPAGGVTKLYVGTDSVAGADLTIDLVGSFSTSNFSITNDTVGGYLNFVGPTSGNDYILGTAVADTIDGQSGNDTIFGLDGNDSLMGWIGDDSISGGAGADTLHGGSGNDTFQWNTHQVEGIDRVSDFGAGDRLEFLAGSAPLALTGPILAGNTPTSLAQGQVMVGTPSGGVTKLYVGADSVAGADLTIDLAGSFAPFGFSISNDTVGGYLYFTGPTTGNDSLLGTAAAETIDGLGGNDTIAGLDGNDSLFGNSGDDSLSGGAGADTLSGGSGSNTFHWDTQQVNGIDRVTDFGTGDWLQFRAGNGPLTLSGPILSGNSPTGLSQGQVMVGTPSGGVTRLYVGADSVAGADLTIDLVGSFAASSFRIFNDTVGGHLVLPGSPSSGNDFLVGTAAGDTIDGGDGNDTILGLDGNDSLLGDVGNDSISGGAGSDSIRGGQGSDTMDGGVITDRINYTDHNVLNYSAATGGVTINLQTGLSLDGDGSIDVFTNFNSIVGSQGSESITGSTTLEWFEEFEGVLGNDTIDGGAIDTVTGSNPNRAAYTTAGGAVTVNLGTGSVTGAAGADRLYNINQVAGSAYGDQLIGSNATAWTEEFEGRGGNDQINGAGGVDIVRYDASTGSVHASLATGLATQDGWGGRDTLSGIEGLRGSHQNDTLLGGNTVNGTGTTDGLEIFIGNGGNDLINGGGGYDRVQYDTSTAGVNVTLGGASNGYAQDGRGGTDTLISIEGVRGSAFNDTLTGSNTGSFESFEGRQGNDVIDGLGGFDRADYSGDWAAVNVNLGLGSATDGWGGTDSLANIEHVRGSQFADTIIGSANGDRLEGHGGDDTITGNAGEDTFSWNVTVANGIDRIADFTPGEDGLHFMRPVGQPAFTLDGAILSGDDASALAEGRVMVGTPSGGVTRIYIGTDSVAGADITIDLVGSFAAANFVITNDADGAMLTYQTAMSLTGTAGNDTLAGGGGDDTISGLAGNDSLSGGGGNDSLAGGNGNDTLAGGEGDDTLAGNGGIDRVSYADATAAVTVNLAAGSATGGAGSDTLATIEQVLGSAFADTLIGNNAANHLEGGDGNDTMTGGAGNDSLIGGAGIDTADFLQGGHTVGVSVTLGTNNQTTTAGPATGDRLLGFENLSGTDHADTLTGDLNANLLAGNGGNDALLGAAGNDTLDGGFGDDTLTGGAGYDSLIGGAGTDTVDFLAGGHTAGVTVTLGSNNQVTTSGPANGDRLFGFENLSGSNHADAMTGDLNANLLTGNGGNDTLNGQAGNDTLIGGAGDDSLSGGGGIDLVSYADATAGVSVNLAAGSASGGAGADTLTAIEQVLGSAYADSLAGNNVANRLEGGAGSDTLTGAGGLDTLLGGAGDDLYVFGTNFGADTVQDDDATLGNSDTFQFSAHNLVDLTFSRVGDDLQVDAGGGHGVTVSDWYLGEANQIESWVMANGDIRTSAQIEALVTP
jgi:Ca2+-binding RTX toxin-like protein